MFQSSLNGFKMGTVHQIWSDNEWRQSHWISETVPLFQHLISSSKNNSKSTEKNNSHSSDYNEQLLMKQKTQQKRKKNRFIHRLRYLPNLPFIYAGGFSWSMVLIESNMPERLPITKKSLKLRRYSYGIYIINRAWHSNWGSNVYTQHADLIYIIPSDYFRKINQCKKLFNSVRFAPTSAWISVYNGDQRL